MIAQRSRKHQFFNIFTQPYQIVLILTMRDTHYVLLNNRPIIEQDVVRVSHSQNKDDLVRLGKDVEKLVLARALRNHLEDRVLVHGRKTVVFN